MKKMYLAIFLIILVAVVFCGCLSFADTLMPTDSAGNVDIGDYTLPGGEQNPVYNIPEVPEETVPVEVTDAEGEKITVQVPTLSEFDILKNGSFYMKGSMTDSTGVTSPMEMAITPSTMFMLSDFSGASMGLLIKGKSVYMIYSDKKAYLELSESLMSMAGMDMSELTSSAEIDFSSLGSLAEADEITEEAYSGRVCQVYHFINEDSSEKRIYMDGTKLIRMATYTASGKFVSSTDVETITASVPADKASPPSSYKAYKGIPGMFSFMTLIEDLM